MPVPTTLSERLEFVLAACEYPSQVLFMKALGESRQQWRNWIFRESVGRADIKLHERTGVDITWLKTGKGDPFPNGPIKYSPDTAYAELTGRLEFLESANAEAGVVISLLIRAIEKSAPGSAAELARLLAAARDDMSGQPSELLDAALHSAQAAQTSAPVSRRVAEPRGPIEKPPRTGR